MPVVEVKNLNNKKVSTLELHEEVFAVKVKQALLHEAVRHYLASQRRGTHKTKTKGDVRGSGRKPWRQKGTGRARVGSIRSPLWRHGGTTQGPQPRDYSYSLPRKVLLGALRGALTAKFEDKKMIVVDKLELENHKTKVLRTALDKLGAEKSLLIVEAEGNANLERASRNLPRVRLVATQQVHPYHVLAHDRVLFSRAAVEKLQQAIAPKAKVA
ncbi:MAG: 50S ribosomal protein L4 [Candidatus Acidiferrales bacterium]|nr:50S ribosomal protein L4 [Acidobacteriota bacterium]MCH8946371.1 50S ribosomal protein L4 [Acidobacteriota bacterium]